MNILLDTHVFLWALAEPGRLDAAWRDALETPVNRVYLSAVSVVELMIKASLGKLVLDFDPVALATESGFELLPLTPEDARPLGTLPFHHRDSFDRMLIAQAITRDYRIMTSDPAFGRYPVQLM